MLGADPTQHYPDRAIMQYGDNYAYLKDDQLLVLQPGQPAQQFHYQMEGEKLTSVAVDPALGKLAHAHALWPSWAYFNQDYVLPAKSMQRAVAPAITAFAPAASTPTPEPKYCVTREL